MIDFKFLEVKNLDVYNKLYEILMSIFPYANHKILINELKQRIQRQAKLIIVEYPYKDFDFSSVYSIFYSKKHQTISKDCIRLHFFSSNEIKDKFYIGNIVVRDSVIDSRGKALFSPKYLYNGSQAYIVTTTLKSHIMGGEFKIDTIPWMSQDTDIAICAHVAIWSINNYFAFKYPHYSLKSIAEISQITPMYIGRKTPSNGLNLLQISDIFAKLGFYPLVLRKDINNPKEFYRAVYSYIESGIPMVGAMTKKEHAVAIVGHEEIEKEKIKTSTQSLIYTADYIKGFVISDDNEFPLTTISKNGKYALEDLDYVIIPLYEKMYINANIVYERVKAIIDSGIINNYSKQFVLRVYLTSIRSLKREILQDKTINKTLKTVLLKLHAPQFVWCADLSTKEEYLNDKMSAKIIIDSTAGTYENEPWIFMHDNTKILWKHNHETFKIEENINSYKIYKNNLKEIKK
jgi:hypothetical protein